MTESAKEKCKRRLISSLKNYQWKYQYSIYPQLLGQDRDTDFAIAKYALLEHDKIFRRKLQEQFSDTAIMFEFRRGLIHWKFKTTYVKDFSQIYMTLHTSKELDEKKLNKLIDLIFAEYARHISQPVTNEMIEKKINSIKEQELHAQILRGIEEQEDTNRVNRFSIINKKHLIPCKSV
ncbi:MAG: hypothetical protein IE909_10020 [Campylobacterales bacterium]|nr:hypothetical protein [Campylobacterales bacterium]